MRESQKEINIRETYSYLKVPPANPTLSWQIVIVTDGILLLVRLLVLPGIELLVHLPAVLVVAAVVHELTGVSEAAVARLLVVLAQHRLVIPSDRGPEQRESVRDIYYAKYYGKGGGELN